LPEQDNAHRSLSRSRRRGREHRCSLWGFFCLLGQHFPPLIVQSDDLKGLFQHAHLVLDEQFDKLFPINETDVGFVGCSSLSSGSLRETTRRDDDPLLMHLQ